MQSIVTCMLGLLVAAAPLAASVSGLSTAPAESDPQIRELFRVAPHILVLRIDAQERTRTGVEAYQSQAGDQVRLGGYDVHQRFLDPAANDIAGIADYYTSGTPRLFRRLFRDGTHIGYLAGRDADQLAWLHLLAGEQLDLGRATASEAYRLTSPEHQDFADPVLPISVFHKGRPRSPANTRPFSGDYTQVHDIYLVFPHALQEGARYELRFHEAPQLSGPLTFTVDSAAMRSTAIQINQHGYHPDQDKLAFLSAWLGAGGGYDYSEIDTFEVVDASSGEVVLSGTPSAVSEAVHSSNLTNAPVVELDFSSLRVPGTYRVVVPGVGCSYPVRIADTVWNEAFTTQMQGYLHQRTGIDLDAYLPVHHPRDLHPDDGYVVHRLDEDAYWDLYVANEISIFDMIQETLQFDETVTNAWGAWRDAGDWDRQADHMQVVGTMVAVWETNPGYFEQLDLGIPESGDGIPDILDEALWCADCFRRAQDPDGAVPGYIESIEHPRAGELSHTESLPLAWVPPSLRDNLAYAGNAAYLAMALERYDADRAAVLAESAIAAFDWAQANSDHPTKDDDTNRQTYLKALTGAALYRMTGEDRWHQVFLDHTDGRVPYLDEVIYINTDRPDVDTAKQETYRNGISNRADGLVDRAETTIYRSIRDDWPGGKTYNLAWPQHREIAVLVAAQMVAPDERFARAIENAYLFALGANPMNLVHITGLGQHTIWPFDKGYTLGWQTQKPPGQSSPGYEDHWNHGDIRDVNERALAIIAPDAGQWPDAEFFFPQTDHNEHTVQTMQSPLWGWGYLAQHHHAGTFRTLQVQVQPLPDPAPMVQIDGQERQLDASGATQNGLDAGQPYRIRFQLPGIW